MSKLEIKQIGKTYTNGVQAVQDFSLDVTEGEFVCWWDRRDAGNPLCCA